MRRSLAILFLTAIVAVGNGKEYQKLVWSDEFDGTTLNLDNWSYETGAHGWGNDELQNYTAGENIEVKDGVLTITARKVGDGSGVGDYTSARIITKGKQEFKYGRVEARLKMPKGRGGWAAFWTLGADFKESGWPACGEIDIMEYVGYTPNVHYMALHTPASNGETVNRASLYMGNSEDEFRVYGIIWDEKSIRFYVDSMDNVIYKYIPHAYDRQQWCYDKAHFLLLNLAVGGGWGGRMGVDNLSFPMEYKVDYVRVYKK